MKVLKALALSVISLGVMSFAHAATITYNLSSDFSNSANPNGTWSFTRGTFPLVHFLPGTPNAINAVLADGYWGIGSDLNNNTPEVGRVTGDGSAASGYSNSDFLAGDVIVHSTNPGSGDHVFINWTAPTNGTIDFSGSVWYAHSPVDRSNQVVVTLAGAVEGSATVNNANSRPNAIAFSGAGLTVAENDVLAFEIYASPGQTYGSLDGISETIAFTPSAVPEPAEWMLVLSGLGFLLHAGSRRKHS